MSLVDVPAIGTAFEFPMDSTSTISLRGSPRNARLLCSFAEMSLGVFVKVSLLEAVPFVGADVGT